ncbi:tail fiber protein [Helicobacter phage UKEN31U]|nr:tail fiber protein [Helicobacter phage UKEN31U]ANT43248.1 tail fiber protein [Helicobacter phage UKEN32U]
MINYSNLPNSALEITQQPEVKEITNELLKQLQNAINSNSLFTEQVELSLKGIVRILEVLLSLDFFKNANEIDSSLRNSIEWLSNAGESLKTKMKEYEGFFSDFNTSMRTNEQEVTAILNANTENIKSEIKKLENQLIETTTRLLTSYQIFLNQARENATTQITANKTESLEAITQAKENATTQITANKTESLEAITLAKTNANNEITEKQTQAINNINNAKENATTQINTNKQEVLNNIKEEKTQATSEITEAKKTAFNELLENLKPKFSGLFVGVYYIYNRIYVNGGWEQKVKDLSDYTLEKNKKYEIEVFFQFVSVSVENTGAYFGLKTNEGFLKESIQKITHKYVSQVYYKKLLVENVSGVLGLYHGYFYGNINYFNEAIITSVRELPNDTINSKVSNGSTFSNATTITQNLNDISDTTPTTRS